MRSRLHSRAIAIGLLALCAACAPGRIAWPTGEDALRTALFRETESAGVVTTTVVLSNGYFDCDLPAEPDPIDQTQAVLDLRTAACRENARHVLITLLRDAGVDAVGAYPGDGGASPAMITGARPRLSNVSYYGIDEAGMVRSQGFVREYGVVPGGDVRALAAGDGGEVGIRRAGETLSGHFAFPGPDISGRFRAIACAPDATLFTVLAQSAVANCPTANP